MTNAIKPGTAGDSGIHPQEIDSRLEAIDCVVQAAFEALPMRFEDSQEELREEVNKVQVFLNVALREIESLRGEIEKEVES